MKTGTFYYMEEVRSKISIENELKRKLIHLSSSVIAITYLFVDRQLMLIMIGALLIISLAMDLMRYYSVDFNRLYLRFLKPILRLHELSSKGVVLTGATYLLLAAFISILIFPGEIAVMAILVMTVCDTSAALVGKYFDKSKIAAKTLEGSLAFFISGLIVIFVTPKMTESNYEYLIAIAALFLTTLVELIPFKIDDNIIIPVFFGLVYLISVNIFL